MPDDKTAHARIDHLEGRVMHLESSLDDALPLLRGINEKLGSPPVPATGVKGSGLCLSVAELQEIEAAKAEVKRLSAEAKARRGEAIKTVGALFAAVIAGVAILGGLVKLAQAMVR